MGKEFYYFEFDLIGFSFLSFFKKVKNGKMLFCFGKKYV